MTRHGRLCGFALAGLALAGAVLLPAQARANDSQGVVAVRSLDTTAWPDVTMTVQYTGAAAPRPEDFTVRNGGRILQGVTVHPLAQTPTPVGVVLVIDTSGSMRSQGRLDAAKQAVRAFVAGRGPTERIAVVAFSDAPRVVHGFSADAGAAVAVDGLSASGETALWDAVRVAAGLFADQPGVQPNIVVLSDGADSVSLATAASAGAAVAAVHAVVHAVSFASGPADAAKLASLAEPTGGKLLTTADTAGVAGLFTQVRRSLDQQFQLTWRSAAPSPLVLTVAVDGVSTAARASAGSVSRGSETRPQVIARPGVIARLASTVGLPLSVAGLLAAVVLLVGGLGLMGRGPHDLTERLRAYGSDATATTPTDDRHQSLAESSMTRRAVDAVTTAAEGRGLLEWLEHRLDAARLPLRAAEASFFTVAFAALASALAWSLLGPIQAVAALLLGIGGPVLAVLFIAYRRRRKFVKQLPEMLQLLSSSLRAGYALLQGVEAVSREISDPMGAELRRVMAEARLGRPVDESLEEAAIRMDSADFSWVVMAIGIQRSVGGNLAELLDTVNETMVARNRLRGEVKALTAEGRVSAMVLGFMPPALGAAMAVLSPGYLNPLFTMTLGRGLLGGAILLLLGGFVWMHKIIKVEL